MVEDHPTAYYDYEGIIPEGRYGAGAVVVWDSGSYGLIEGDDPMEALGAGKIAVALCGRVLKGGFTLVKLKGRGEKNWLLIKKKDDNSQPGWVLEKALTRERKARLREITPPCEAS